MGAVGAILWERGTGAAGVSGSPVWSQASLHAGLFTLKQQMPRSAARWPWGLWSCHGTALQLGEDWEILLWAFCGLSVGHGELQVNPNETAAAPSPRGCGGQLRSGVFQGTLSPATPLGEVISNDGKPTAFLLGFPADREILFTFFLKEFFFS